MCGNMQKTPCTVGIYTANTWEAYTALTKGMMLGGVEKKRWRVFWRNLICSEKTTFCFFAMAFASCYLCSCKYTNIPLRLGTPVLGTVLLLLSNVFENLISPVIADFLFFLESNYLILSCLFICTFLQQFVCLMYVLLLLVWHHLISDCSPRRVQGYGMSRWNSQNMLKLLSSFARSTLKFLPRLEADENYCQLRCILKAP
jgi:hypothetical protein